MKSVDKSISDFSNLYNNIQNIYYIALHDEVKNGKREMGINF